MQSLNLSQLPISEKFLMMEQLWENLTQQATDNGFTPQWHIDILDERAVRVKNGESSFSTISDAKKRLQSFVNKY